MCQHERQIRVRRREGHYWLCLICLNPVRLPWEKEDVEAHPEED